MRESLCGRVIESCMTSVVANVAVLECDRHIMQVIPFIWLKLERKNATEATLSIFSGAWRDWRGCGSRLRFA